MTTTTAAAIRPLKRDDAPTLAAIDAAHTGIDKAEWWRDTVARHLKRSPGSRRVGLVAEVDGEVVGYLLGQVREFEFGSEPCGWIFAVGVRDDHLRRGVARALLDESRARFSEAGVRLLRTMTRKDDVPTLTFFRSAGFEAGPYVELELPIGDDQGESR